MLADIASLLINLDWAHLAWPIIAIMGTAGFVIFIRWFGDFENKAESVGADLNMLTFGFGIDLLVELMRDKTVLPGWHYPIPTLIPTLGLIAFNGILFMTNLKLAKKINSQRNFDDWKGSLMKVLSFGLGVLSVLMFIYSKAFWG